MIIDVLLALRNVVIKKGSLVVLENSDHIRILEEVTFGPLLEPVISRLQPHVVLIDEDISGIDVFAVVPTIRRHIPDTRFIVYVDQDTPFQRERCLASGIGGLLVKVPSVTDTVHAICRVAWGEVYFPSKAQVSEQTGPAGSSSLSCSLSSLTDREKAVLQQIICGKKRKEIARNLFISANTVKTHKRNILEKLDLRSEAELIKLALGYQQEMGYTAEGTPKSS